MCIRDRRRLAEMAVLIKDVTTCKELRPLLQEYQRAADKKQFRRKHEGTLILYEAAAKALKEQGFQKLPDLYALKNEYKQLAEQKDQMQRQYNDAKRQMQEYGIIKPVSYTHLFVRHYISGKSSYTHFSASKDGSRKPNDQRRQCCKERIEQPLTDVHFT